MQCRACGGVVEPVVDFGDQPSGAWLASASDPPDERLPLRLGMCRSCGLAQLADPSPPEPDDSDAPSPLTSTTMAAHAGSFVDDLMARGLATPRDRILSLASHGGHLAPFFRARGLATTVVESPSARADRLAAGGQPVLVGRIDQTGADAVPVTEPFNLVVDSYLLAHLDQPRGAIARIADLLAPGGTVALEFDDLTATVEGLQWDAIGHGHPVYLSLAWLRRELEAVGLVVVDASRQPAYGGAIRVYAQRNGVPAQSIERLLARDAAARVDRPDGLTPLAQAVERARRDVMRHLVAAREAGLRVVGYGAPARAITFLNALGIDRELLPFVVDRASAKQGRVIPGVRIPIRPVEALMADPPDELLVLTWNLVDEVRAALAPLVDQGAHLFVAIPRLADVTEGPRRPGPAPGDGPVR